MDLYEDARVAHQRNFTFTVVTRDGRGREWIPAINDIFDLLEAVELASSLEVYEAAVFTAGPYPHDGLFYWSSHQPQVFNSTIFRQEFMDSAAISIDYQHLSMLGSQLDAISSIEWVDIPNGNLVILQERIAINQFAISKYPITNLHFQAFIEDDGYAKADLWVDLPKDEDIPRLPIWPNPILPRVMISFYEAIAFTRWLSMKIGRHVALPTEAQWQWAAIGDTSWTFAYGMKFDKDKCNTRESGILQTTPVDRYPQGISPFGVMDMCGNIWEWCLNEYVIPSNFDIKSEARRVLRGGSYFYPESHAHADFRFSSDPHPRFDSVGFRVVAI